jgi:His-Xaa-Ser system radical SAM maturase HxsC
MKLHATGKTSGFNEKTVLKVTTIPVPAASGRKNYAFVLPGIDRLFDMSDYGAVISFDKNSCLDNLRMPVVSDIDVLSYLTDGDVVSIQANGVVRTLYRRNSPHNFILMTVQCNSFCLMCSQPPQMVNDFEQLAEHHRLVELIDKETGQLGITGGEPTLFKDGFLSLIDHCKTQLPETALHVLTNGRMFYYRRFARALGEIGHPDLMLGIPLYSDVDSEHDYVVQAKGAFEETVLGLHHLAQYDVPIEIRIVLHRQTIPRLPQLAEFIARNFPFASHVALMGLEMFGFVHRNYEELWIDPYDYQTQLKEAVEILSSSVLNVSIYNHQLCVLDRDLWNYSRRSISDWKNIYLPECETCSVQQSCGGLFQSAVKKHSSYIKPFDDFRMGQGDTRIIKSQFSTDWKR